MKPAFASTLGPVWPVTAPRTSAGVPCTSRTTATTSHPPAAVVNPDLTPITPWNPSSGVYVEIVPATGSVTDVCRTMAAKVGLPMSGAATFKRSPAVDCDA